jgi:phage protein
MKITMESKRINAVANEFLSIPDNDISLLKLLKLCYFAQGFSLAALNRPIFDDPIEAWQYGPVVPALYHEFKHFKSDKITKKSEYTYLDDSYNLISETPILEDDKDKKIVQLVWKMYGKDTAGELVNITHKRGTPWDLTYIPKQNNVIPLELIEKYYKMLIKNIKK